MENTGIISINPYFFLIFLGSLPKWPKGTGLGPVEERLYAGSNPATTIILFLILILYYFIFTVLIFPPYIIRRLYKLSSDKMSSENNNVH